jgi:hypothetical protein
MVKDYYTVDDSGKVYGTKGEMKSFWQRSRKYPYQAFRFQTKDGGKITKRRDRLVALAWVDGRTDLRNEVDHINGIHSDDRPENLRWSTHKENSDWLVLRHMRDGWHYVPSELEGQIQWAFMTVTQS